jgi:hypothetical protein
MQNPEGGISVTLNAAVSGCLLNLQNFLSVGMTS